MLKAFALEDVGLLTVRASNPLLPHRRGPVLPDRRTANRRGGVEPLGLRLGRPELLDQV